MKDIEPKAKATVKKSEVKTKDMVKGFNTNIKSFNLQRFFKAIALVVLIGAIALAAQKLISRDNPIHDLKATTYLSKSSRDNSKQAKTDFSYLDPIQLGLEFRLDDLDEDQIVNLGIKVFEVSSEPNTSNPVSTDDLEPLKTITIGQIKSGDNLFVTIPNPGKRGTYQIEVYLDQDKPRKLTQLSFNITQDNSEAEAKNQELEKEFNSALEEQQRADDPASAESDPTSDQTNQTAQ
ncbi:hypothetical protein KA531_01755 [Candidatus Saccharibacteria bacterium]|nr:hypothetical protein [Candidatus Saccharibacteria bacterium]